MQIRIDGGLPFVTAIIGHHSHTLKLNRVLVDTGSAGTIFNADRVADLGLVLEPHDTIFRIRGVGGAEFVFAKIVDSLAVGKLALPNFQIEVGAMDYGFKLDGIIGMDFLHQTEAILDLGRLEIRSSR